MKDLREITAYEAIEATIKGFNDALENPNFFIDMSTFGTSLKGLCYGCMATVTLQSLNGRNFLGREIFSTTRRAKGCGQPREIVEQFESAIDDFRKGGIAFNRGAFKTFFNIPDNKTSATNWYVTGENCEEEMEKIEVWLAENEEVLKAHTYFKSQI